MRAMSVLLIALLSGCGSFVPTVKTGDLPPGKKHAMNSVRILNAAQLLGAQFEVLTIVEGHSCKNMMTDPPATRAGAIDQLKFYAAEAGANAIANIQCAGREGTSYNTNCWELISCTAEAIKLQP